MKIVLASKNEKKAKEMQRIVDRFFKGNITVVSLSDLPEVEGIEQADENGSTFLENAKIKAEYWAKKLQIPALAEDSGIEIEALNGAPGVYTKRAMVEFCPNEDINIDKPSEFYPKLLEIMKKTGNPSKNANFVCAMVLAFPNKCANIETQNTLYGEMCECAGEREFGFDQYFKPNGYNQTLSEMQPEEKDSISPRLKSIKDILIKFDL